MAKTKTAPHEPKTNAKVVSQEVTMVDLRQIVSNTGQSRGMGVLSNLKQMGVGLFEQVSTDRDPIWPLLVSDKPEERQAALATLRQAEPEIAKLAANRSDQGALQPIGVWFCGNDEIDVIYGMRRAIAETMLAAECKDSDWQIEAKVFTFDHTPSRTQLLVMSQSENLMRSGESPIDLGLTFREMLADRTGKPATAKIGKGKNDFATKEVSGFCQEMATAYNKSAQWIRDRIDVTDEQMKDKWSLIHNVDPETGKARMSMDAAVSLARARREGVEQTERPVVDPFSRGRFPNIKSFSKTLVGRVKPEKMSKEEWEMLTTASAWEWACWRCNMPAVIYTEPAADAHAGNGQSNDGKPKMALKIPRSKAIELLICLGQVNARQWGNEIMKEKLANPAALGERETPLETETAQKLYAKVWEYYDDGNTVEVVDDPAKKKGSK